MNSPKKYLIIDKHQRIQLKTEHTYAVRRLFEEISEAGNTADFAYYDQLEIIYSDSSIQVKANNVDVSQYDFIVFRGHRLDNDRRYQIRRMLIDYIDLSNSAAAQKTHVQNSESIKLLPYYNKIYLATFCAQNNLPYFKTYFRLDGDYENHQGPIANFPMIAKEYAGANDLHQIDGKLKVKKNVFKIDSPKEFNQKHLKDQDLANFFIQEFSPAGEDFRIFIANGKVVGGWKRESNNSFMTVRKGIYSGYNQPDDDMAKLAMKTSTALEANFIAVDIMRKADGKPYIQEISLNPGFKAYETKISGNNVNLAEIIVNSF
ncbi:hypothetical protein GF357_03035 [Candidatus Dojkabacteria bacterium]|nr:hypothetical protein [Candidatus Dojkabacteria bacterium]